MIREKFEKYVTKQKGCWLWSGTRNRGGYGYFHINRRCVLAHRASWVIHFGEIPNGLCVLHKCDNPECTRPSHLFLGTRQDNMIDMDQKGRRKPSPSYGDDNGSRTKPERLPIGERNGSAKLTTEEVLEIREIFARGIKTKSELAASYDVSPMNIAHIVNRQIWRHV
jgi:hypothetical protein